MTPRGWVAKQWYGANPHPPMPHWHRQQRLLFEDALKAATRELHGTANPFLRALKFTVDWRSLDACPGPDRHQVLCVCGCARVCVLWLACFLCVCVCVLWILCICVLESCSLLAACGLLDIASRPPHFESRRHRHRPQNPNRRFLST